MTQWLDIYVNYDLSISLVSTHRATYSYYSTIDYISYAVLDIPVALL